MTIKAWEFSLLDWTRRGAEGAHIAPEVVMGLLSAASDSEAARAYWRLDGVVCANGLSYAAALPVTQMILSLLPACSLPARRRALELLGQISTGESHPDSPRVVQDCLDELLNASWYLLHGLQFDSIELTWLYVDLVGVLGEEYSDFREKARKYLDRVMARDLQMRDKELIQSTLDALL